MASNYNTSNDPALTHTLTEFISMQSTDELTYRNFSILDKSHNLEILDHNLLHDYITDLEPYFQYIVLTNDESVRYKYAPDLLAYDVYGSTQLDFAIMILNGVIDPKEFTFDTVILLYNSAMNTLLSEIYSAEIDYIKQSRSDNGLKLTI